MSRVETLKQRAYHSMGGWKGGLSLKGKKGGEKTRGVKRKEKGKEEEGRGEVLKGEKGRRRR